MIQQFCFWVFTQRKKKHINLRRYAHPNVHSSIIYNNQDMKLPKSPSKDKWMKKMWYMYSGLLLSHTKKSCHL